MDKRNIKKIAEYWHKTAEHDYKTMLGLFRIKRYSDCLFFGHIVLEKILKAHVVKNIKEEAPKTHDLVMLAKLAKLELPLEDIEYLKVVNRFNMRTRYPDVKFNFYKLCTREYASENLNEIKKIYKTLCQKLKQKK
jgi:HEPN domain-containing protein